MEPAQKTYQPDLKPGSVTTADGLVIETNVRAVGDMPLPHEMVGGLKMQMFAGIQTLRSFADECLKDSEAEALKRITDALDRAEVDLVTAATGIERHLNRN